MGGGELIPVSQGNCLGRANSASSRHVFTGIAQYFNLTWSIWMRYCVEGKQDEFELVWPSMFTSVPAIERPGYARSAKSRKLAPKKKL